MTRRRYRRLNPADRIFFRDGVSTGRPECGFAKYPCPAAQPFRVDPRCRHTQGRSPHERQWRRAPSSSRLSNWRKKALFPHI